MVSVIVPAYNTEKYIGRCLRSILDQTFEDIEVIVINDGSTDDTLDVINAIADEDRRISVISQENHGLVYSRKQGILRASGEYVLFVDSDDYIDSSMVEELVKVADANDADAVFSGSYLHVVGGLNSASQEMRLLDAVDAEGTDREIYNFYESGVYEGERLRELKDKLFCAEDYCTMAVLPYLWNKLWKISAIKEHVLSCDEQLKVGEDVAIGFPAILTAEKIVIIEEAFYHYCQYPDSMMRGNRDEGAEYDNAIRLYKFLLKKGKELGASDAFCTGLDRLLVNQLFTRCYEKTNAILGSEGLLGFIDKLPDEIVIYGAGELGKAVYCYVKDRCHVKAWIDAGYDYYRKLGYPVESIEDFQFEESDEVIVAVFNTRAVSAIEKSLISKGVNKGKIHCFCGFDDYSMLMKKLDIDAKTELLSKERVIIYGTGRRAAMYYKWIASFCDIRTFVSDSKDAYGKFEMEDLDFHKASATDVIGRENIGDYEFDKIIVTAENDKLEESLKQIEEMGCNYIKKSISLDEFTSLHKKDTNNYLRFVGDVQLEVIKELLNATDEQVSNFDWMIERVRRYGMFCFPNKWMHNAANCNFFVYGLQQVAEEFAAFCNYISDLKIETAAEIGVYRGRSSFFICAVLARKNKNLTYKMIDLYDRIDDFDEFHALLPQLQKCIPSSSDDYKNESFDFVFIDADHSYDASINDFNNVGQKAKVLTAFHDVYAHEYDHENGGTVRMWNEVLERTADHEHAVFSEYPDKWMGIGVVKW